MKTCTFSPRLSAFSLVEAIMTLAVLGFLAAIALQVADGLCDRVQQAKLESDVRTLNTAIKVYLANGGSLDGVTRAEEVIGKLKTVRNRAKADRYAGFRGSMLDARVSAVFQNEQETASSQFRALWNPGKSAFEISSSGLGGIARFDLDASTGALEVGEEERAPGAVDYNVDNGWIWAYRDAASPDRAAPTVVPINPAAPGALPRPSTGPQRLAPPQFSTAPGSYHYPEFPTAVSISNPNPQGSSTLFCAMVWDGSGIQWFPYTAPLSVVPGTQVLAQARQASAEYEDSFTVGGVYVRKDFRLLAPQILTSAPHLNLQSNEPVTLELIDSNPAFALHGLEYSINGAEFVEYQGPLSILPSAHGTGFQVAARSVPKADGFLTSPESTRQLSLKLRTPGILAPEVVGSDGSFRIPVTLTNPNPEGSSDLLYALQDRATGQTTPFIHYTAPFEITAGDYAKGLEVIAYAASRHGTYLASDQADSFVTTLFNAPVLDSTIFLLDTSGSLNGHKAVQRVKDEMGRLLAQLTAKEEFAIVFFSKNAQLAVPFRSATPENVLAGIQAVENLSGSSADDISGALSLAKHIAQGHAVKQVLILTDGFPNAGNTRAEGIAAQVAEFAAQGTQVNVLPFGYISKPDAALIDLMNEAGRVAR